MRTPDPVRIGFALVLLALGAMLSAGQASAAMSLSASGDAKFPERSYVLTLPEHSRLGPEQVTVTENGSPVRRLRVAPLGNAKRAKLGVVLAVDSSASMRGEAFQGAIDAARAFTRERNPRQPLGVVTFGSKSRVLLPFTDEEHRIEAALAEPGTPSGGTHLYDATLQAIELVSAAKLPGGFVVLLSDGTDHGSVASSPEVVAAAKAANVRIYTVGLQSDRFDPEALAELAENAGGEYSEARSPAELREVYRALGAQLSNAHVLTYRSLVGPGRSVEVRSEVAGLGAATTSYRSPALALGDTPAGSSSRSWDSPIALAGAILLVAGLLGVALLTVLRGPRKSARERVVEFVGPTAAQVAERPTLTGRLAQGTERSLARAAWWDRFATEVDVAAFRQSPGQLVLLALVVTVPVAAAATSVAGTSLAGLVCLLLAPAVVAITVRTRTARQRRLFGDQVADHLAVVGGSLRAGHSLPGALANALDEAPEPARREFARAVADERLGVPLEEALETTSARMQSREVEHIALLAKLQREAGADAAEMVDQVVTTVRERAELRRTVRTLTAQGRLAQAILSVLPVAALVLLSVTNRPYVEPLFETSVGNVVLAAAAALVVAGSLVIRKIVSIKI